MRQSKVRALVDGAAALCSLALMAAPAQAQIASPAAVEPPPVAQVAEVPASPAAEAWSYTLSPYVWFSGLSGEVIGSHGTESFDAGFGDIFAAMKFSFMGLAEARRGRLSLVFDTLYLNLQQGVPVPGLGAYSGGSARTQSAEISAIALYTVMEESSGRIEFGGGIRGWWFGTEVRLDAGLLPARTQSSSTSWLDPVISARGVWRMTERLAATAYADVGGFGLGSQLTWQAFATLDYRVTETITASAGIRWIHINYDKGRATIDLDMRGPIIGATFRF
jgi:opacity protein-like surface antigen